jgi:hypothetical protein
LVVFISKYGVISAKESEHINEKKRKSSLRSQENEVRKVIFCENASFYSVNSNPAEN